MVTTILPNIGIYESKRLTSQQTLTFGDPAISTSNIAKFGVNSERRTQVAQRISVRCYYITKKKVEKRHCLLLPLQSAQNRAVHPILFPLTPTNLLARRIPNLVTSGVGGRHTGGFKGLGQWG